MRTLIRPFNPMVSGKGGQPLLKPRWSGEYWASFEELLTSSLRRSGHDIHLQPENANIGDDLAEVDLAIYAHRNQRDTVQQTVYSYPKFASTRHRLFYMMMHLPGWFQLDASGWGAENSSTLVEMGDTDASEAEAFVTNLRQKLISSNTSKIVQPAQQDIGLKDYILILGQLENDYTIRYQSPITVANMISTVANWAYHSKAAKVVIKRHPLDQSTDTGGAVRAACQDGAIESTANIHSLISGARAVFVINSGAGFESLIHNKPVITFGRCDYKRATFAADRDNLLSAWSWVVAFNDTNRININKFILWYYKNYIFDIYSDCNAKLDSYLSKLG